MDYNYIVIEGNIGAGKTSLATRIADELKARLILERFAENPFLSKFYKDPEKYSFQVELSFLVDRYQQLKENLSIPDLYPPPVISDYYFSKSLIFAGITLSEDECNIYRKIYNIFQLHFPSPDLYVYLHLPVEILLSHIRKRGRNYESNITADYLNKLQIGYFDYFKEQKGMKIIVIDISNIDFVNNQKDYQKISDFIVNRKHLKGINRIFL